MSENSVAKIDAIFWENKNNSVLPLSNFWHRYKNVVKSYKSPAKQEIFYFLVIENDTYISGKMVECITEQLLGLNVKVKPIINKADFTNFYKEHIVNKTVRLAGTCDLHLGVSTNDGIDVLNKLKLSHSLENFYVVSSNVKSALEANSNLDLQILTECRAVLSKDIKGKISQTIRSTFSKNVETISMETVPSLTPDKKRNEYKNKIVTVECEKATVSDIALIVSGNRLSHDESPVKYQQTQTGAGTFESALQHQQTDTDELVDTPKINKKIKRLSFKVILDENHKLIECDLYEQVNYLLSRLLNQENYHLVSQLIHTLVYNPYAGTECLLNINGYTIFYQDDYENTESDSDLLSRDFIKYYNEVGELDQITIGGTDRGKNQYRFEDDSDMDDGIIKLCELDNTFNKVPLNNLIITFFYIKGIVGRLNQNEENDEEGEKILVEYWNKILENHENPYVKKVVNLEMGCLLFEGFFKDEVRRKRLMQSMNLPEVIDFYYCVVTEAEEGTSKINIRNVENDFNLTESIFSTQKLQECGLKEGDYFKYIRFKENQIINPFEGNSSYVIFPITKEMFDRK